jgi:hypothetical protein
MQGKTKYRYPEIGMLTSGYGITISEIGLLTNGFRITVSEIGLLASGYGIIHH